MGWGWGICEVTYTASQQSKSVPQETTRLPYRVCLGSDEQVGRQGEGRGEEMVVAEAKTTTEGQTEGTRASCSSNPAAGDIRPLPTLT